MKYDLLITVAEKDYNKLPLCIQQCKKHLIPQPQTINIVSPTTLPNQPLNTISYLDEYVVNIKKEEINYLNQGWIYKQLINLFQDITPNDYYLSVDADVLFLNDIKLFYENSPKFFITNNNERHPPYFILMNKIYGYEQFCAKSFISDFMMFKKSYCREFFGDSPQEFLNKINPHLFVGSLLADYEWYGNMVYHNYTNTYVMQNIKSKTDGRFTEYTENELRGLINIYQNNYDMVVAHTWGDTSTLEDQRHLQR